MEQERDPNPQDNPSQSNKDTTTPVKDSKEIVDDKTETDEEKKDSKQEMPPLPACINEKKDGWKSPSSIIGIWQIVINGILAIFTILLWWIAYQSLNSTNEQFKIVNRPSVQGSDFSMTVFEAGKEAKIFYMIKNFGNYQAEINGSNIMFRYFDKIPTDTIFKEIVDSNKVMKSLFVNRENPQGQIFTSSHIVTEQIHQAVIGGIAGIIWGEIYYSDKVMDVERKLQFAARVFPPPSKEYDLFINRTKDMGK